MIRTVTTQVLHRAIVCPLRSPKLSDTVKADIGHAEVAEQLERAIKRSCVLFHRNDADPDRYAAAQEARDVGKCSLVTARHLRNDIMYFRHVRIYRCGDRDPMANERGQKCLTEIDQIGINFNELIAKFIGITD
jgi:hypothetical protein